MLNWTQLAQATYFISSAQVMLTFDPTNFTVILTESIFVLIESVLVSVVAQLGGWGTEADSSSG